MMIICVQGDSTCQLQVGAIVHTTMVGVQEENTKRDDGLEKSDQNDQNVPNNTKVQ
jgi:hypothetical protein